MVGRGQAGSVFSVNNPRSFSRVKANEYGRKVMGPTLRPLPQSDHCLVLVLVVVSRESVRDKETTTGKS